MSLQDLACAEQDTFAGSNLLPHDLEPQPVWPIEDADQCVEAIESLALDIGYFADLVQAARRIEAIKAWVAREKARLEAGCPVRR